MNTAKSTQMPAPQPHVDEICHIGNIHPTLVALYPEGASAIVEGYKKAFLGKRIGKDAGYRWAVVQVFGNPDDKTKVMARMRKLKDGQ